MIKTYPGLVVLVWVWVLGLAGCSDMETGNLFQHDRVDILRSGSVNGVRIGMDLDEAKSLMLKQGSLRFTSRLCLLDNEDYDGKQVVRTSQTPCPEAYEEDTFADNSFFHYGAFYISAYQHKVIRVKFRHSFQSTPFDF